MPEETTIAGISCSEVLSNLSDFVDGALPPERVAALKGHLAACEYCARFGNEFTEALGHLKARLRSEESLAGDIAARLQARLDACDPVSEDLED